MTHNPGRDTEVKVVAGTDSRTVWVTHSTDDGLTWAKPTDITKDVKKPGWTWYATGPGVGSSGRPPAAPTVRLTRRPVPRTMETLIRSHPHSFRR